VPPEAAASGRRILARSRGRPIGGSEHLFLGNHRDTILTAPGRAPSGPACQPSCRHSALGIKLDVDGGFGTNTAGACRQFQRASRIPVTGIADQATWASLDIALDTLRK
jgi:peptidoglycan hydrolase-like protein with peptidoglycan-binding domain